MKLREILRNIEIINVLDVHNDNNVREKDPLDIDIKGISYDSKKVKEGYLFVAVTGEKHDGHEFIHDAIEKGACAIVGEKDISSPVLPLYFRVKNSRKALACISSNYYGNPSEEITLIGITGTNGKTTTSYILKSIIETWGKGAGLIGTIQYMIKDKVYPALHTTPEALEFQGLLKEMSLSGCTHVVSEVSSHALAQNRVDGSVFKTAVFTNLTRDHLDFHKTMENYYKAKERLFKELLSHDGVAIINLDDQYGLNLNLELKIQDSQPRKILTYGLETRADIIARDVVNSYEGLQFRMIFRRDDYEIRTSLIGMPNVYNIMAAFGVSIALGIPIQTIIKGIEKTEQDRKSVV
jgi:UDP-N-acetylmuramoyl-L-alanyl-D-glutamate--2,6-diaminopimelate ligase